MKTFRCIFDRYKKSVGGSSCNKKRSRKVELPGRRGSTTQKERGRKQHDPKERCDESPAQQSKVRKQAPRHRRRGSTTQGSSSPSHPFPPLSPLRPRLLPPPALLTLQKEGGMQAGENARNTPQGRGRIEAPSKRTKGEGGTTNFKTRCGRGRHSTLRRRRKAVPPKGKLSCLPDTSMGWCCLPDTFM